MMLVFPLSFTKLFTINVLFVAICMACYCTIVDIKYQILLAIQAFSLFACLYSVFYKPQPSSYL